MEKKKNLFFCNFIHSKDEVPLTIIWTEIKVEAKLFGKSVYKWFIKAILYMYIHGLETT